MYIKRHNKAVCMLQAAVSAGTKGGMLCVMMDACPASDLPDGVLGTRLPKWLLPRSSLPVILDPSSQRPLCPTIVRRKLRPDLLYVEGLPAEAIVSGAVPRSTRKCCTVHVIEIGYVAESPASLAARVRDKHQQHAALCAALSSAGWRLHEGSPNVLLLGQAGTVFDAWSRGLDALGVVGRSRDTLLNSLHVHALTSAAAINLCRTQLESGAA
jgi:hypothetical protein